MAIALSAGDVTKLQRRANLICHDLDRLAGEFDLADIVELLGIDRVAEINNAAGAAFCTTGDDLPDSVVPMVVDGVVFYLLAGGYLKVRQDEQGRVELFRDRWDSHLERLAAGLQLPDTTAEEARVGVAVTNTEPRGMFANDDDRDAAAFSNPDAANLRRYF